MDTENKPIPVADNSQNDKPSKIWKTAWRIVDIPFIVSFAFCALMTMFCLFNLKEEWGGGGLIVFAVMTVLLGLCSYAIWRLSGIKIKKGAAPKPAAVDRMWGAAPPIYPASEPSRVGWNTRKPEMSAPRASMPAMAPKVMTVTGSYAAKLYVYDPKPILGIREGKPFTVTVVTRSIALKSRLTGGVWRTGVDSGYALAYRGKPFGVLFNSIAEIHIGELLAAGATEVQLTAMRQGWYMRGCPEVYGMVPTMEEAREREEKEKTLKEYEQRESFGFTGAPDHVFRIGGTSWNAPEQVPEEGYVTFEVSVERLPTPDGSTAKPHVILKEQERIIAEVSARSGSAYLALAPLVGKRLKLLVRRYYASYDVEANEI